MNIAPELNIRHSAEIAVTNVLESDHEETVVITETLDQATEVLKQHEAQNMLKYAVYNCRKDFGHTDFRKRKHNVYWKDKYISFSGVPYFIVNRRKHDCHLGKDRKAMQKERIKERRELTLELDKEKLFAKKGKAPHESKKLDCPAQVSMIEIVEFPDFQVPLDSSVYTRTSTSGRLREMLQKDMNVNFRRKIVVVLPGLSFHKGHGLGESEPHEAINCISWLIGNWTGKGNGKFPTIKSFSYIEDIIFEQIGQPMLNYRSITRHHQTLKPMHQEAGYLKIKPGTTELAFCLAQNTGIVEIEEGSLTTPHQIDLKSTSIGRISFGKEPAVREVSRQYKLIDENHLELTVYMETSTHKKAKHLQVLYTRKDLP